MRPARLPPQCHLIIRHSFGLLHSDLVILQRTRCRHVFSLMPVWFARKNELKPPRHVEAFPCVAIEHGQVERVVLNALVPPRWNGRRGNSSTRWSRNRGTALQPDIFAAPNVTVVAGVSPAVRPPSQATRLPPQIARGQRPRLHHSKLAP